MHRLRYLAAVVLFTIGLAPNLGADWPQWRGPDATGIARDAAPLEWRPDANIAWRAEIGGLGVSSPIVSGNKVIVTSQTGFGPFRSGSHPTLPGGAIAHQPLGGLRQEGAGGLRFLVEAFDRASGGTLWTHTVTARGPLQSVHEKANLASSSPVTDGERVYVIFGTGQTVALTMDGNEVWSRHLGEEYGRFSIVWGHASSPVVYQDLLILQCDHSSDRFLDGDQASGAYLVALDTRTGEERWKVERGPDLFSYSTPFVVPGPDGDELVLNSSQRVGRLRPGHRGASVAYRRPQSISSPGRDVRRRCGLHEPGNSQRSVYEDPPWWSGRRDRDPRRLADTNRGAVRVVAPLLRRPVVHGQRRRDLHLRRCGDG